MAPTGGKSLDEVDPVTYARPAPSIAIALPTSKPPPPNRVEYSTPVAFWLNLVTKASPLPLGVVSRAPAVVGKLLELASPVTYALPVESTAIPRAWSCEALPPRNVEYTSSDPLGLSFVTV